MPHIKSLIAYHSELVRGEIMSKSIDLKLRELSSNLWWSWQSQAVALFARIDPLRWERTHHNPVALLNDIEPDVLSSLESDQVFCEQLDNLLSAQAAYLASDGWCDHAAPTLKSRGVFYLSMEFGLHESLPIYSGGLGVLAGDHLRSASDLCVPMTGVGLLYRSGYFLQSISDFTQVASYPHADFSRLPVSPLLDKHGKQLQISVQLEDQPVVLLVHQVAVGRVKLLLLNSDTPENSAEVRALTSQLYGGDNHTRIQQELLLGIGAVRLAKLLGHDDPIFHLNEGHCAFALLALMNQRMAETSCSPTDALTWARARTVFTTHTPVAAGHDRFEPGMVARYTKAEWADTESLLALGRVDPNDASETLCMTVLALRGSTYANGVSKLHGAVSREMWHSMWPEKSVDDVPISHITNGVHPTFWMSAQAVAMFDCHTPGWRSHLWDTEWWEEAVQQIPNHALLTLRQNNRKTLLSLVKATTGKSLNPDALTIGFARRFAPYKRGDLLFRDPERAINVLKQQNAQIIFAGKAHPKDTQGKALVSEILKIAASARFRDHVAFIPNYDISVGRTITAGADLWLNNPRRPMEASGTSGQKVPLNGGINLSVLDGWWDEGYTPQCGFAIGDRTAYPTDLENDALTADALYDILENTVGPEFNQLDSDGQPSVWLARIRASIAATIPRFTSHRMVRDYVRGAYEPLSRQPRD
jgi:alpha-glucan phosphorylase-like protein